MKTGRRFLDDDGAVFPQLAGYGYDRDEKGDEEVERAWLRWK